MKVFGSSGIRGVANDELTPAYTLQVAQAAGSVLDSGSAVVARDTRLTGDMLVGAASSGLASVGLDVTRFGVLPTPALQAYCEHEGVPGMMITASHNPPQYNGIKLVGADGVELPPETLERIERRLDQGTPLSPWTDVGTIEAGDGATAVYKQQLLERVDSDALAGLTVAIDPGHGAASTLSPTLFRELGCRVLTVNAQADGRFPGRDPEPVAANLGDLCRLVRTSDAALGVAHDGDGDRAIFIDETGAVVEGGAALAALAAQMLGPGDVAVSAVNASQRLVDVVNAAGAELTLTPIGSTNIIAAIRAARSRNERVPIAGEGNGGIIFPAYRIARDGMYTAIRFAQLVTDRPTSDVVAEFDDYHNVRRDISYATQAERQRMMEGIERFAREADAALDTTDGYRLEYGDGWVLARPSGTEPVIRVYAEARDEDRATSLAKRMAGATES